MKPVRLTPSVFLPVSERWLRRLCERLFLLSIPCLILSFSSLFLSPLQEWSVWSVLALVLRLWAQALPFWLWCFFRYRLYLWRRERNQVLQ